MKTLAPVPVAGLSICTSTTSPSIISVSSRILTPMLLRNAWEEKWPIWNRSKPNSLSTWVKASVLLISRENISEPAIAVKGVSVPRACVVNMITWSSSLERCDCQVRLVELNTEKLLWGYNLCNTHGNCSFSCARCSGYQDSASGNFSWGNPQCYDFFSSIYVVTRQVHDILAWKKHWSKPTFFDHLHNNASSPTSSCLTHHALKNWCKSILYFSFGPGLPATQVLDQGCHQGRDLWCDCGRQSFRSCQTLFETSWTSSWIRQQYRIYRSLSFYVMSNRTRHSKPNGLGFRNSAARCFCFNSAL